MEVTRLAPSPTGALHLGNARTFLVNWLLARQNGWQIILRIEDLDGPRIKRGADHQLIQDLLWLGLNWDEGPVYQSFRLPMYQSALQTLIDKGVAYPCVCSRREVENAASAPHSEDGAAVYPGTCRGRYLTIDGARVEVGRPPAIRFHVPAEPISFHDGFAGPQTFQPADQLGDFVISKSDGTPAYQLAVVVDDADMGVTQVVRGADLIDSTPRQILLYRALGLLDRTPRYYHLPLVLGTDGRRLAKRHGDTRLSFYRDRGVPPAAVLALLGRWCGVESAPAGCQATDLLQSFRLESLPKHPIVFTPREDARLLAKA